MPAAAPKINLRPAPFDMDLWRGDEVNLKLILRDKVTKELITGLPTEGWASSIRVRSTSPDVLASFEVDTSEIANSVIYLMLAGGVTSAFPAKCVYDLECAGVARTYIAGTLAFDGDVTK